MRHVFPRSIAPRPSLALRSFAAPALVALAACLTGCGGGGSAEPPVITTDLTVVDILPSANYVTTDSALVVQSFEVAAESAVEICWGDISVDIQGHAVNPEEDIDQVSFVRVKHGDEDEVSELLNTGELGDDDVEGNWEVRPETGQVCAKLDTFKSLGDQSLLDPEEFFTVSDEYTYLVVFATGTKLGFGARTMLYLEPTDSVETEVNAPADSEANLTFEVDLAGPDPLVMPSPGPWKIDWSAIQTDNHGNTLIKNAIDRVLIGFYEDKEVADLEESFLDLDQKTTAAGGPDRSWEIKVKSGTTALLADAVGRDGEGAFTNFETDKTGTWLIGAFCGECRNPAPVVVTILDPK